MNEVKQVTGFEAGLSGDEQIRIALLRMIERGGEAQMPDVYEAVESRIRPRGLALSKQGRASLRFFVNRVAVQAGYVYPHDKESPGWRITPEGREFLGSPTTTEEVAVNVDTGAQEHVPPNTVQGAAFERWVMTLLRASYPHYAWYDQGRHKMSERGLDFVGTRVGDSNDEARSIGVQVKLHQPNNAPTQDEWLKFLAGCFARRVESAIFVTTGRLTGNQRVGVLSVGRALGGRPGNGTMRRTPGGPMTAIQLLVAVCAIGATLATPRAQEPQRPGNGVTAPTVVKRVNPEYTQEALAERIEGVVGLSIVVRPDGSVGDVDVTKSLDSVHGLDQQAVKAMKQWEFKPGTKDGKPVAVRVDVQMTFTLK